MVLIPTFCSLREVPSQAKQKLPQLYFYAWSAEKLCNSVSEAEKVLSFDPQFSFVGLDEAKNPFGLLNTLPLSFAQLQEYTHEGTTYRQIEEMSRQHQRPSHVDLLLCFSLCGRANTRVVFQEQEQSIARFMIMRLKELGHPVYVYTRRKSVSMHIHLGANPTPVATIQGSRPEDIAGEGENIILQYQ